MVYKERLQYQYLELATATTNIRAKFGGATGNFNAHYIAYPEIDWQKFSISFLKEHLTLKKSVYTTQVDHNDSLCAVFNILNQVNAICIDFCQDIWLYMLKGYFTMKHDNIKAIGSSTMPHKVNPCMIENAMGNFYISNGIFNVLCNRLPISFLQRDLSNSTLLRNIGVAMGHSLLALKMLKQGLHKLIFDHTKIQQDLDNNWTVLLEAVQTILRKHGKPDAYEQCKAFIDKQQSKCITKRDIHLFIENLDGITTEDKQLLKTLSPHTYIGSQIN